MYNIHQRSGGFVIYGRNLCASLYQNYKLLWDFCNFQSSTKVMVIFIRLQKVKHFCFNSKILNIFVSFFQNYSNKLFYIDTPTIIFNPVLRRVEVDPPLGFLWQIPLKTVFYFKSIDFDSTSFRNSFWNL